MGHAAPGAGHGGSRLHRPWGAGAAARGRRRRDRRRRHDRRAAIGPLREVEAGRRRPRRSGRRAGAALAPVVAGAGEVAHREPAVASATASVMTKLAGGSGPTAARTRRCAARRSRRPAPRSAQDQPRPDLTTRRRRVSPSKSALTLRTPCDRVELAGAQAAPPPRHRGAAGWRRRSLAVVAGQARPSAATTSPRRSRPRACGGRRRRTFSVWSPGVSLARARGRRPVVRQLRHGPGASCDRARGRADVSCCGYRRHSKVDCRRRRLAPSARRLCVEGLK